MNIRRMIKQWTCDHKEWFACKGGTKLCTNCGMVRDS